MCSTVAAPAVLSLLRGTRADKLKRIFMLDIIQSDSRVSAFILRRGAFCQAFCQAFTNAGLFFVKSVALNLGSEQSASGKPRAWCAVRTSYDMFIIVECSAKGQLRFISKR